MSAPSPAVAAPPGLGIALPPTPPALMPLAAAPPPPAAPDALSAIAAAPSSWWWTGAAVAAGALGSAVLAYAVYFDYKRRSDPAFRKRIRDAYREDVRLQQERNKQRMASLDFTVPPLPTHPAEREQFMMDHLQRGENVLRLGGPEEKAAFHFFNAARVVPNPTQLIQLFQQSLPSSTFNLILQFIQQEIEQAKPGVDID